MEKITQELAKGVLKASEALSVSMTGSRLKTIVEDLIEMYPADSIEDIYLALKRGRRGEFGKVYGRLDLILIREWMDKILDEKAEARETELARFKEQEPEPGTVKLIKRVLGVPEGKVPDLPSTEVNQEAYNRFKSDFIRDRHLSNQEEE